MTTLLTFTVHPHLILLMEKKWQNVPFLSEIVEASLSFL